MLTDRRGGLGLTGGISDVASLADCLLGIHEGKAGLDILDKYDQIRRRIFNDIIEPTSSENLKRLRNEPHIVELTDSFFIMARQAATDPDVAERLKLVSSLPTCKTELTNNEADEHWL